MMGVGRSAEVADGVALAKCADGDTAYAIPILERKLINQKVELPRRPPTLAEQ